MEGAGAGGAFSSLPTPQLRNRSAADEGEEEGGDGFEDQDNTGKGHAHPSLTQRLRLLRMPLSSMSAHPLLPLILSLALVGGLAAALVLLGRREPEGDAGANAMSLSPCGADGEEMHPFIYVYDLGGKYTEQVRRASPSWYSEVYDAEKLYLEYVLGTSAVRTWDPENAMLFYVPFYAAYFLSCQYKEWENNMREAVMRTSEAWESVLNQVKTEFPFFNRTNGGDHFSVLSMDYGRCQSLTYLDPRVYGDMFFLTAMGDKMLRSTHTHIKRNIQILTYNYGARISSDVPDIPCFRPDMDIVIPPTVEEGSRRPLAIVSPFAGDRSIAVLFRFRVEHHHKQAVLHSNHYIRKELYELYRRKALEGWEFGVREPEKILREDMQHSVFCVCPPGHSQWTSRLVKAISAGCIPVTFFRDNENPWQDEVDYHSFSVNVDPDALPSLRQRLEALLQNPRKVVSMQRNLEKVQKLFVWNETCPYAVQAHVTRMLWCKAKKLNQRGLRTMKRESGSKKGRSSTHKKTTYLERMREEQKLAKHDSY